MEKYEVVQKYPNAIVFSEQKKVSALTKDLFAIAVLCLDSEQSVNRDLLNDVTVTITPKMIQPVEQKYDRIRKAARELSDFSLILADDPVEEHYEIVKPFIRVKYKKGTIVLIILSEIAQQFVELKRNYTNVFVKDVLSLHTFRAKRFYELMVGVKNMSLDCKRTFPDEELKVLLQVGKGYMKNRHKEFEERIIATSIEEINLKTGVFVSYERTKIDKGEYSTLFTVIDKHKEIQADTHDLVIPLPETIGMTRARFDNIVKGMQEWGISRVHMATIFNDAHLLKQYTNWRYAYLQKNNEDKAKIKSPSAVVLAHLGLTESKNSKKYLEALAAREKNGGAIK